MATTYRPEDLEQMAAMGLNPEAVDEQIRHFREGFPHSELLEAATIENGGIITLDDAAIVRATNYYARVQKKKKILKFVPASGAASRMFKDLYAFSASYTGVAYNFEKEFPTVKTFLENLHTFAFAKDLKECMEHSKMDITDYMQRSDYASIVNVLLKEQYMGYGSLPKALLLFHKYGEERRTPLEEHIVEGAEYAKMGDGTVHLHFTVSPEHRVLIRKKIASVRKRYEQQYGIKLRISLSEQKHYTDTIAVDEYNNPVRDEEGRLTFRPGGHGALIENLNECRADLIFVKNIDNVVPDWMKHTTIVYKKALAGLLLELQEKNFKLIKQLKQGASVQTLKRAARFAREELHIDLGEGYEQMGRKEQCEMLIAKLNRPMRVCGMVKNQGEPGGGPFYTRNSRGMRSLQIVETAQINRKNPEQESILNGATHFNPVDLVCCTKDYRGRYFDLRKYVDVQTGFISKKSKGATVVKSQELPGLWNGAMAEWITLFVEVPLATFNPVKTVNDLLRTEHQEG